MLCVCGSDLYASDQFLHALLRRHIHGCRHVVLTFEVMGQDSKSLIGRILVKVSDHHGGALGCESLTDSSANLTAPSWTE